MNLPTEYRGNPIVWTTDFVWGIGVQYTAKLIAQRHAPNWDLFEQTHLIKHIENYVEFTFEATSFRPDFALGRVTKMYDEWLEKVEYSEEKLSE